VLALFASAIAAEPVAEQVHAGETHVALQNALKRLGLSDSWYSDVLTLTKPTPSLELPVETRAPAPPTPAAKPADTAALLQEVLRLTEEEAVGTGGTGGGGTGGASGGANPTYILPQNPWTSNYPFPPPSPYAYNPYAPTAYGYSQPFANPPYAPGGGGGGTPFGLAYAPGIAGNIAAPTDNDFFSSSLQQPAARDPSFIYPAPNFVNPLYVSPRMPNGAFSYYAGFASAIPQGPLSDPTPFPVGSNPANSFPQFRQRMHVRPTAFAEESSNQRLVGHQQQSVDQQGTLSPSTNAAPPQPTKRFFRPEESGTTLKVSQSKSSTKILAASESANMHECNNCFFSD